MERIGRFLLYVNNYIKRNQYNNMENNEKSYSDSRCGKQVDIVVNCPHCQEIIVILELNCKIFRHGVYKTNFEQINPHMNKTDCDKLSSQNLIYGCGKPFRLDENNNAIICEYI